MPTIFFSYSHSDETFRDQLEVHLSALKRQKVIESWHDRKIIAGSVIDDAIDRHLNGADVILLLISPDFIASDYCYDKEVERALQRHSEGTARVIPVILRPCDWHGLPFGKLLATPTDGRAITLWPDRDEAFLDVVKSIKVAVKYLSLPSPAPAPSLRVTAIEDPASHKTTREDMSRAEEANIERPASGNSVEVISMQVSEAKITESRIIG
jgi:hypothetical protein